MFELRDSEINGKGVFATEDIPNGITLGVWCTKNAKKGVRYLYNEGMECNWYETEILGRWCNHSNTPNISINASESELLLVSNGILSGDEILVNYSWVTEHTGFIVNIPE